MISSKAATTITAAMAAPAIFTTLMSIIPDRASRTRIQPGRVRHGPLASKLIPEGEIAQSQQK